MTWIIRWGAERSGILSKFEGKSQEFWERFWKSYGKQNNNLAGLWSGCNKISRVDVWGRCCAIMMAKRKWVLKDAGRWILYEAGAGRSWKSFFVGRNSIGAVLVDDTGHIIASGHNMREHWQDATAHAEVVVIQEACRKLNRWRLSGTTLFVWVSHIRCVQAHWLWAGLTGLFTENRIIKQVQRNRFLILWIIGPWDHQLKVTAGVMEDACAGLLQQFFETRRKR